MLAPGQADTRDADILKQLASRRPHGPPHSDPRRTIAERIPKGSSQRRAKRRSNTCATQVSSVPTYHRPRLRHDRRWRYKHVRRRSGGAARQRDKHLPLTMGQGTARRCHQLDPEVSRPRYPSMHRHGYLSLRSLQLNAVRRGGVQDC